MTLSTRVISRLLTAALVSAAANAGAVWAAEEKYPSRPIEMVVNFGPGGGADIFGRAIGRMMEKHLGVPIPISNISGAAGTTGLTRVQTSSPDGYTVGTITGLSISSWAAGLGRLKPEDFTFIAITQSSPSMLFVPRNSQFKDYRQLLDYAKQHPNKVRVATAGFGTLDDISIRYLAKQGYPMVNVPFNKPGERYISPMGGHTEVLFEEPGDITQFLQSGELVPIVVFGKNRHPAFPDVPASAEFGHDIDLPNWRGLVTAAKVPPERTRILHEAVAKAMSSDEWKKFCAETYTCIPVQDPEQSLRFARTNYDDLRRFMTDFGIIKAAAR
jgi:tripartite-type tricarboxylate transporter receptor subunit TctC